MSKGTKTLLIIGIIAVISGIILAGLGFGLVLNTDGSWQESLSTVEYIHNTYTTTEEFESIDIDCTESDITLVLSDELTTSRVECSETDTLTHKVEVKDSTLCITVEDNGTFFNHFGINMGTFSATIYLPKSTFENLSIDTASGDISIPDTFTFAKADLSTASGDITFLAEVGLDAIDGVALSAETASGNVTIETRTIMGELYISTSSGYVSINNTAADEVTIHTASGRVEAFNLSAGRYNADNSFDGGRLDLQTSSGDVKLSACEFGKCLINTASGEVKLDGVDADNYVIETSSGDVTGTIRSYKNFITSTSSGNVNVPSSNPDNGECRISTASGDIDIEVVF